MPRRRGNKIHQIKSTELARQACDLWEKYECVRVMARFEALHAEMDKRLPNGGRLLVNLEKKRRNAEKAGEDVPAVDKAMIDRADAAIRSGVFYGPGHVSRAAARAAGLEHVFFPGPGGGGGAAGNGGGGGGGGGATEWPQDLKLTTEKPYPERDLLEMVSIMREIEALVGQLDFNTSIPMFTNALNRLCRRALRNYPTTAKQGKHDDREDASNRTR